MSHWAMFLTSFGPGPDHPAKPKLQRVLGNVVFTLGNHAPSQFGSSIIKGEEGYGY